jgi:hypothetical protein
VPHLHRAAARASRRTGLNNTSDIPASRHRRAYSCAGAVEVSGSLQQAVGRTNATLVAEAVRATIGRGPRGCEPSGWAVASMARMRWVASNPSITAKGTS